MIKYQHLVGREFVYGEIDCYSMIRDFYADNFKIHLPNYARPKDFWKHGMNLYGERFYENGFRSLDCHPREWQVGDVFLMAVRSSIGNHTAVLVEKGKILHHLYNRRSNVESYQGLWRNCTVAVLRHKDVVLPEVHQTVDIRDHLPPRVREKIDAARQALGEAH